jgi:DNA primase
MRERLARKAQQLEIDRALTYQVRPPFPASHDLTTWTPAARLWLYKAGLNPATIQRLGAYYHAPTGRVVLPVYGNGEERQVIFWQARNPEYPKDGGAKYISSSVPRDRVHVHYRGTGSGTAICLTEDILSAFKVGESGAAGGYAVMGTALGQHTIAHLLSAQYSRVLLWFDPDAAGDAAVQTISKQLRLVGLEPVRIVTTKDPKCYSFAEIRSIIDGVRSHAVADHARAEEVLSAQTDVESQVG